MLFLLQIAMAIEFSQNLSQLKFSVAKKEHLYLWVVGGYYLDVLLLEKVSEEHEQLRNSELH